MCQCVFGLIEYYDMIKFYLFELCGYYCDLQVYKYVIEYECVLWFEKWFIQYELELFEKMEWYEFLVCVGFMLGIFCFVVYLFQFDFIENIVKKICNSYFFYI